MMKEGIKFGLGCMVGVGIGAVVLAFGSVFYEDLIKTKKNTSEEVKEES